MVKQFNSQSIHPEWQKNVDNSADKVYWFAFLEQVTSDADLLGISYDPRLIKIRNRAESLIKNQKNISSDNKEIMNLHRIVTRLAINKNELSKKQILNIANDLLADFKVASQDELIKEQYFYLESAFLNADLNEDQMLEAINHLTERLSEFRNTNRQYVKQTIDSFYNLAKEYQVDNDVAVSSYFKDMYLSLFTAYSPDDFKEIYSKIENAEKVVSDAIIYNKDEKTVANYTRFIIEKTKEIVDSKTIQLSSFAETALAEAKDAFEKNQGKNGCLEALKKVRGITVQVE